MIKKIAICLLVIFSFCCKNWTEKDVIANGTTNYYSNPILQGFYPDPSICKVDGEFYMVNSTFAYFPGIPIFKSLDLVNWEQIGNVLDRPEQLNLDGLGVSRGIFAPAISYCDGIFYVVSTLIDGKNNFVVTAKNPEGPWSNPIWLPEVSGIDPSLFFNTKGKSFIVYNSESPDNKPEYDGHRTIKCIEFDKKALKTIGKPKVIINKGAKPDDNPIWIEGPHMYQLNGYYYLMAAEGGTAEGHSEVIFRSKTFEGPYQSYSKNPILTQRHLDTNRKKPIACVGHADLIEDNFGNWYGVFLGCRAYDNANHYNTGRETFMAPVKWKNNWPIFDLGGDVVKRLYPTPNNAIKKPASFKNSGNFFFREDFDSENLGLEWLYLRTPREKWHTISKGALVINTRPESVSLPENPSFIGYRQQHIEGSVSTEMIFNPSTQNEKAGLIAFQNESHFYYLCKGFKKGESVVQLFKSKGQEMQEIASQPLANSEQLRLKIESNGTHYNFLFSQGDNVWNILKEQVDARFLSTKEAGGFVGTIYAMYTTSLGQPSSNSAKFEWFNIENLDE